MDSKFNEVELEWIMDMLSMHGEYIDDILQQAIDEKDIRVTGNLASSITYKVEKQGNNPVLNILFSDYGRFIEIRYHKSRNTRTLNAIKKNRLLMASNQSLPQKRKKDTRWYARNVYGSLNRLIGILMYEFTEKERERIKGILEFQKNNTL